VRDLKVKDGRLKGEHRHQQREQQRQDNPWTGHVRFLPDVQGD
jgi:hypothetical protein